MYCVLWNGITEWPITSRQIVCLYATWRWSSDRRFYAALREKKLRLWSSLYRKDLTNSSYSLRYLTSFSSSELPVSSSKHWTVHFQFSGSKCCPVSALSKSGRGLQTRCFVQRTSSSSPSLSLKVAKTQLIHINTLIYFRVCPIAAKA